MTYLGRITDLLRGYMPEDSGNGGRAMPALAAVADDSWPPATKACLCQHLCSLFNASQALSNKSPGHVSYRTYRMQYR